MSDKLNFSLPKKKTKPSLILFIMLIVLIISLAFNILMFLLGPLQGSSKTAVAITSRALSAAEQKELALKLQKSSLYESAARAWKEYLAVSGLNDEERAAVWYTIGKIYQEADLYEPALDSYYRSEAIYEREDIRDEISRRIQDCLEYLGKFAALRYELSSRVGLQQEDEGAEILAEIGTEKITRADLDKKIEQYIDFQLSQYAAYLDPESLTRQREELFKHYATEEGQQEMLNQQIVEEVLYRKAREEQLAEDPVTRAMLRTTERQVLAQQLVAKKKGAMINITESDLRAYYETVKGDYIEEGVQKSFEEVRNDLYSKLIARKEREVEQQLIEELRQQYNVVIHAPRQTEETPGNNEE